MCGLSRCLAVAGAVLLSEEKSAATVCSGVAWWACAMSVLQRTICMVFLQAAACACVCCHVSRHFAVKCHCRAGASSAPQHNSEGVSLVLCVYKYVTTVATCWSSVAIVNESCCVLGVLLLQERVWFTAANQSSTSRW
jgi:hypothetical protein